MKLHRSWKLIQKLVRAEIKENMYIALETYAGDPESEQGVRLEENLVVTKEGYEIFSRYPFDEKLLD